MVKNTIDPPELQIGLISMENVSNSAVIISCESKEERYKLKTEAESKLGDRYEIGLVNERKPKKKLLVYRTG